MKTIVLRGLVLSGLVCFILSAAGCSLAAEDRPLTVTLGSRPGVDDVVLEYQIRLYTLRGREDSSLKGRPGTSAVLTVPREETLLILAYPLLPEEDHSVEKSFFMPLGAVAGSSETEVVLSPAVGWGGQQLSRLYRQAPALYHRFNKVRLDQLLREKWGTRYPLLDEQSLLSGWEGGTMSVHLLKERETESGEVVFPEPGVWVDVWGRRVEVEVQGEETPVELPRGTTWFCHPAGAVRFSVQVNQDGSFIYRSSLIP